MSRELRRVPIDFDWPLNKVWKGYVNPHHKSCSACESGYTHGYWAVERLVHRIALAAQEAYVLPRSCTARDGQPHPWVQAMELGQLSPEFGEFVLRLCGERAPKKDADVDFFHDFTEEYRRKLFKVLWAQAKLPKNWGKCKVCKGRGMPPAVWSRYKAWRRYAPPKGTGYQVWETVSEGSPISPVFNAPDEVVAWLVQQGHSEAGARAFVKGGWAPSGVGYVGGPIVNGIDGLGLP